MIVKDSFWCPGRDSNPHTSRHTHLKRARLPIPPPGLVGFAQLVLRLAVQRYYFFLICKPFAEKKARKSVFLKMPPPLMAHCLAFFIIFALTVLISAVKMNAGSLLRDFADNRDDVILFVF